MLRLPIDTQVVIRKLSANLVEKPEHMDIGNLTHAIVKSAEEDRRLHLVAISRRLLYCCPLHDDPSTSEAAGQE